MGFFSAKLQEISDRLSYGFGNQEALGRLTLAAATNTLMSGWRRYAGRKRIVRPTVGDLLHFLEVEHGIEVPPNAVTAIFGGATTVRIDVETIMPRIADMLIDAGVIDVEWGQRQ